MVTDAASRAIAIVERLREATRNMEPPLSQTIVREYGRDPYLILVSCLLSLRAKDRAVLPVSRSLFVHARTPQQMLKVPRSTLERVLHSIGYFRQKAQTLHAVSAVLVEHFGSQVPRTQEELISLPGVGPKTANLVLGEAFGVPAICVDIHVHRISNRLGLVQTTTPEQTEAALKQILPRKYWIEWNQLLVTWGQNVCVPISPFCSRCAIADQCERRGVTRSR